ncbi:MAG TPA: lytic transglycosylase domain-containing protein [Mesorhizobium sp.]|uniref:lytic transglycosylase domain-containing protein n=1 Tax=Mesorhizobium sp. TaxID=1871066 RepID=UPI002DDCFEC3|nr:lytic transglycosylase domain-containing protein [Mesorhizobium sp.]HEV2501787.1 lytic transglycosylase domain-containing protein [Mesorhizobium sp.]
MAVALAATCAITVCANGQDISKFLPILPENAGTTTAPGADAAAVSGVFETRWAVPTSEYVLEASGTLKRSAAADRSARSTMQSGNLDSLQGVPIQQIDNTFLDMSKGGNSSPDPTSADTAGAIVSECGPSPVEPAGIKALVEEAATRHGVDPGFAVAIVATESDFDRDRNSPKGARGPMQLMPETADRFDVDEVCDPASNIDGGVRYLRTLLDEFGNPLLAAAAYNAGEQRIHEYGGIPPFAETVSYVAKVVNHQLGLEMPPTGKTAKPPGTPDDEVPDVGVVAPRRTGTFVAGVMHF